MNPRCWAVETLGHDHFAGWCRASGLHGPEIGTAAEARWLAGRLAASGDFAAVRIRHPGGRLERVPVQRLLFGGS
jgi:hypothetical protein